MCMDKLTKMTPLPDIDGKAVQGEGEDDRQTGGGDALFLSVQTPEAQFFPARDSGLVRRGWRQSH